MRNGYMHKSEIDIITLGCSKNLVDAERVMRRLEVAGYTCVHDSPEPKGEIAIINTCGFIGDAKEESINMILQMAERTAPTVRHGLPQPAVHAGAHSRDTRGGRVVREV